MGRTLSRRLDNAWRTELFCPLITGKETEMTHNENEQGEMLLCRVAPRDIDLFNKLLEGYDNLAYVTAVDAGVGRMALRFAATARKDLMAILHCLPFPVAIES
ncbi:MAG: DUF4911 domain-containing protein [Firmicutes bacterium]|nr:DUF4911 domain-containing protein [Bacillota bacterium]